MRAALTVSVLLIVILGESAGAHVGDRVFPVWELPTSDLPDLHDDTLEDWEEVLPDASLDNNDLNVTIDETQKMDPSDLAIRVFLAWHGGSQRLLVGLEWVDDVHVGTSESLMRDQMLFMIDGDHSGERYRLFDPSLVSESERQLLDQSHAQMYTAAAIPWSEEILAERGGPGPWNTAPPWSDVSRFQEGESPSHVVMEMYFTPWDQRHWEGPEQSQRTVLEAGKIIGFQLMVWDTDALGSEHYMIGERSPAGNAPTPMKDAECFADGELIPCYRGDCSGASTVVKQDSWGRIKASFR